MTANGRRFLPMLCMVRCPEGAEGSEAAATGHDPSGPAGHLPSEAGEAYEGGGNA
jgi:hypothetical protein